jgi:secondary thiamine-phosphate synthase enzyme
MPAFELHVRTSGEGDVIDLTSNVTSCIAQTSVRHGLVCVFVVGSTASITTIEFEPGLVEDLPVSLERLAPRDGEYQHEHRWHDDNGHSHVRAAVMGPSVTVPVIDGDIPLGTWQQIVLVELDTRRRERRVVVQVIGDALP